MRPFLFAILATSLTAVFVSSFALTRVLITSPPARSDTEIVVKQFRIIRVATTRPIVTGYKRGRFDTWNSSTDYNTRHKVLVTWFGDSACSLDDGLLCGILDPYADDPVDAHEVDVNHIHPLTATWDFEAYIWDAGRHRQFGSDIETNLIFTRSTVNRDKGDASSTEWLPEDTKACDYSHRYLTVAIRWNLPISSVDWKTTAAAYRVRMGKDTEWRK